MKTALLPRTCCLLVVLTLLTACVAPTEQTHRYYWPPPPDKPRIEWIKSYSSQLDIEKSAAQLFWSRISGEDQPVSLVKPLDVKSVPELNRFYVSDVGMGAVMVFDLAGHELRSLRTPQGAPPITYPLSITADRDNNLYLLERSSKTILVFDRFEKFSRAIDLSKTSSINKPVSLSMDKNNDRMYVADSGTKLIYALDKDGNLLFSFGGRGEGEGQFNLPISVTVNSKGHVIVADAFNAYVQVFDLSGKYLRRFGRRGDSPGDFQLIKSVAVDSNDNIYVVDGRSHAVFIFNERGELLMTLGGFYAVAASGKIAPGGFSVPVAIDIDSTGRMYVVDQLNSRVQVFQRLEDYPVNSVGR